MTRQCPAWLSKFALECIRPALKLFIKCKLESTERQIAQHGCSIPWIKSGRGLRPNNLHQKEIRSIVQSLLRGRLIYNCSRRKRPGCCKTLATVIGFSPPLISLDLKNRNLWGDVYCWSKKIPNEASSQVGHEVLHASVDQGLLWVFITREEQHLTRNCRLVIYKGAFLTTS